MCASIANEAHHLNFNYDLILINKHNMNTAIDM